MAREVSKTSKAKTTRKTTPKKTVKKEPRAVKKETILTETKPVKKVKKVKTVQRRRVKKSNRNALAAPIIFSIFTLIVVTFGAAYSYFSITATTNYDSTVVDTTIGSVGRVMLVSGKNMTISLDRADMMIENAKDYYASSEGKRASVTPVVENIGTASVIGDGNFNCTYDIDVTTTGNLYTKFYSQSSSNTTDGEIVLTINGVEYDFNTANLFPLHITNQQMNNLTEGTNRYITASLKIVNKQNVIQDAIKDSNLTLTFEAKNLHCDLIAN